MALTVDGYRELLAAGCAACTRRYFKVRAFATGVIELLDGEPVSKLRWIEAGETPVAARIYRIECSECAHVVYERDDCPLCLARGSLARALGGRHGLTREAGTLPRECPRCGFGDLRAVVEARMHALLTLGSVARRVADAESHEPGFHVIECRCPSCEETIAVAPQGRCSMCGRSSLMKRPAP